MVVPLNHLGVESHKAIDTNYTDRRKEGKEGASKLLLKPPITASLEETAGLEDGLCTVSNVLFTLLSTTESYRLKLNSLEI